MHIYYNFNSLLCNIELDMFFKTFILIVHFINKYYTLIPITFLNALVFFCRNDLLLLICFDPSYVLGVKAVKKYFGRRLGAPVPFAVR